MESSMLLPDAGGFGQCFVDVQRNARAHRRGERKCTAVDALDARWFCAIDGVYHGEHVFLDLGWLEAPLSNHDVHVAAAIVAEFDTAALELADDCREVSDFADHRA